MRAILSTIFICFVVAACARVSLASDVARKFVEFNDINCEDESAHLDNFAVELQNNPESTGYIIFYGGRTFRRRLPRFGESAARAARIEKYLITSRGISADRIVMLDGGYRETWQAELWIVPRGAVTPKPTPTLRSQEIKFRKGKARTRDYECEI